MIFVFFFNDTATTEIYTLSLHDALPILPQVASDRGEVRGVGLEAALRTAQAARAVEADGDVSELDRKSTRLNSSHGYISYAVFCLKKKKGRSSSERKHIFCRAANIGKAY